MKNWDFNLAKKESVNLPDPFGFSKSLQLESFEGEKKANIDIRDIVDKKARSLAMSPASGIFMALFMSWMAGNSLNIFTIIFTFQVMIQPIKQILGVNKTFESLEGKKVNLLQYKLMYIAIVGVQLLIGFYKFSNLGLLPTSPSDWIDLIPKSKNEYYGFDVVIEK